MTITQDIALRDFEFWSGAKYTRETLTEEQLDSLEQCLTDCYPGGLSDTELNDIFWFERDFIAEALGFLDWEHLERVNCGEDDDEGEE